MTTLSATLKIALSALYQSVGDLGTVSLPLQYNATQQFTDGIGAGQAQKIFTDTRTLGASGTENLDLNGVLADAFGTLLAFTKVKALVVKAAPGNTNDVLVGGAAANGFVAPFGDATDFVKVKPGGVLVLVAPDANGYTVTPATADLLKITNSAAGTGVTYDIAIVGI